MEDVTLKNFKNALGIEDYIEPHVNIENLTMVFCPLIRRYILMYLNDKTLGFLALSSQSLYVSVQRYRFEHRYFDTKKILKSITFRNGNESLAHLDNNNKDVTEFISKQRRVDKLINNAYKILENANKLRIDVLCINIIFRDCLKSTMRIIKSVRSIDIILHRKEKYHRNYITKFLDQCHYIKDKVKNIKLINPIGPEITIISRMFDLEKFSIFTHSNNYRDISLKGVYIRCSKLYFNVLSNDYDDERDIVLDDKCKDVTLGNMNVGRNCIISNSVKRLTMMIDDYAKYNIHSTKIIDSVTHLNLVINECRRIRELSNLSRIIGDSLPLINVSHLVINGYIPDINHFKFKDTLKTITYNSRFHYDEGDLYRFPVKEHVIIKEKYMMTICEYMTTRPSAYTGYLNKPIREEIFKGLVRNSLK
jgi:hypothetical protein